VGAGTTGFYCLTVLEAGSPSSKCPSGLAPCAGSGGESGPASTLASGGVLGILALTFATSPQSLPWFSHGGLSM
jgi:hypothetical protein